MTEHRVKPNCCQASGVPCERDQPIRLINSGVWLVALSWTQENDGTVKVNDFHQLPEDQAKQIVLAEELKPVLALLNVAADSVSPRPAQVKAARRRLADLLGMGL